MVFNSVMLDGQLINCKYFIIYELILGDRLIELWLVSQSMNNK